MTGHKKTLEEVQGDLQQQLIDAAKQLLKEAFNATSDKTLFEPLLHDIASRHFVSKYGFAYSDDGQQVHPTPTDNNPNSVVTVSKFCSIDKSLDVDMGAYIDEAILRAANLPKWMNENVKADLTSTTKRLLAIDTARKWQLGEYSQTYDAASGDPDQSSYQVKSVLVYVNGTLTEDSVTANKCILYYMAAYYKVTSQFKLMRQAIEQSAYNKVPGNMGTPNDLLSLSNTLKSYVSTLYKGQFHYDYTTTPPDLPKDVTNPYCKFNDHLFYTPDLASVEGSRLQDMITNELFAGLNLSSSYVKDGAIKDMMGQFRTTQSSEGANSWLQKYIEQTYHPQEAIYRPIRANIIMLHFYGDNVTDQGQKIKVLYIYCMAMFYEIVDKEVLVRQDVLKKLVDNLHPEGAVTADPDTLKDLIRNYARKKFKDQYGFDFLTAKAPDQTTDYVQRYQNLFTLPHFTATEVKEYVEDTMFKPGVSASFPGDISLIIFNSIVERVVRYADDNQNHDNQWTSEMNPIEFRRGDTSKKNVKEYSVFVHAIGVGSNAADGGAVVKQGYLYYLSYFCSTGAGTGFDN